MSCVYNGAVRISISIPVPTWNSAKRWATGLAEVSLKLGPIGHRQARAVGDEHGVAVPPVVVVDRGPERAGDAAEQLPEQGQGQASPGLAVGRAGEALAADPDEMVDGR